MSLRSSGLQWTIDTTTRGAKLHVDRSEISGLYRNSDGGAVDSLRRGAGRDQRIAQAGKLRRPDTATAAELGPPRRSRLSQRRRDVRAVRHTGDPDPVDRKGQRDDRVPDDVLLLAARRARHRLLDRHTFHPHDRFHARLLRGGRSLCRSDDVTAWQTTENGLIFIRHPSSVIWSVPAS